MNTYIKYKYDIIKLIFPIFKQKKYGFYDVMFDFVLDAALNIQSSIVTPKVLYDIMSKTMDETVNKYDKIIDKQIIKPISDSNLKDLSIILANIITKLETVPKSKLLSYILTSQEEIFKYIQKYENTKEKAVLKVRFEIIYHNEHQKILTQALEELLARARAIAPTITLTIVPIVSIPTTKYIFFKDIYPLILKFIDEKFGTSAKILKILDLLSNEKITTPIDKMLNIAIQDPEIKKIPNDLMKKILEEISQQSQYELMIITKNQDMYQLIEQTFIIARNYVHTHSPTKSSTKSSTKLFTKSPTKSSKSFTKSPTKLLTKSSTKSSVKIIENSILSELLIEDVLKLISLLMEYDWNDNEEIITIIFMLKKVLNIKPLLASPKVLYKSISDITAYIMEDVDNILGELQLYPDTTKIHAIPDNILRHLSIILSNIITELATVPKSKRSLYIAKWYQRSLKQKITDGIYQYKISEQQYQKIPKINTSLQSYVSEKFLIKIKESGRIEATRKRDLIAQILTDLLQRLSTHIGKKISVQEPIQTSKQDEIKDRLTDIIRHMNPYVKNLLPKTLLDELFNGISNVKLSASSEEILDTMLKIEMKKKPSKNILTQLAKGIAQIAHDVLMLNKVSQIYNQENAIENAIEQGFGQVQESEQVQELETIAGGELTEDISMNKVDCIIAKNYINSIKMKLHTNLEKKTLLTCYDDIYYDKYLKYKNKYLNLKKMI
jgi:hypothetical protein